MVLIKPKRRITDTAFRMLVKPWVKKLERETESTDILEGGTTPGDRKIYHTAEMRLLCRSGFDHKPVSKYS